MAGGYIARHVPDGSGRASSSWDKSVRIIIDGSRFGGDGSLARDTLQLAGEGGQRPWSPDSRVLAVDAAYTPVQVWGT